MRENERHASGVIVDMAQIHLGMSPEGPGRFTVHRLNLQACERGEWLLHRCNEPIQHRKWESLKEDLRHAVVMAEHINDVICIIQALHSRQ
jgi:hypothetical protein